MHGAVHNFGGAKPVEEIKEIDITDLSSSYQTHENPGHKTVDYGSEEDESFIKMRQARELHDKKRQL